MAKTGPTPIHGCEARQETPMSKKMKCGIRKAAQAKGMRDAEWVRRVVRQALRREISLDVEA